MWPRHAALILVAAHAGGAFWRCRAAVTERRATGEKRVGRRTGRHVGWAAHEPLEIKSVIQKASVIATEVGIHLTAQMDSRLRGNDSFITGLIF